VENDFKVKISLVIPALNEEQGIEQTISGFRKTGLIDEIIVVDNGSTDQTSKRAHAAGARVVFEENKGYGSALLRGISECKNELIVLCEADNSFFASDLDLLLPYIKYFDMVKGARSHKLLIADDADYGFILRWGNWVVAKFQTVLYSGFNFPGETSFREMGGTFRVIRKDALDIVRPQLTEKKSAFLADLTSLFLRNHLSVLEIPVRYRKRLGVSKITGNKLTAILLGFRMLGIIIRNRLKRLR
jgi:glycosyltransferase involved in cell wall biosynthesis